MEQAGEPASFISSSPSLLQVQREATQLPGPPSKTTGKRKLIRAVVLKVWSADWQCGSSGTRELVRNADSWAPPQPHGVKKSGMKSSTLCFN